MPETVYVLLDIVHTDPSSVARQIRRIPGVTAADVLEGPPDIHVAIQAPDRKKAAVSLMRLLDAVDGITEDIRVLPVRSAVPKELSRQLAGIQPAGMLT